MGDTEESIDHKFVVRTPGKLILTGEHAVVYGKLALATSVELQTEIFLTLHPHHPSSSFVVYLEDLEFNWSLPLVDLNISSLKDVSDSSTELLERLKSLIAKSVPPDATQPVRMSLLALCFLYSSIVGGSPRGFELRIKSKIPIGAGLGSSAAFSVGSSTTFHLLCHLLSSSRESFVPNLEMINSWAFQCEKLFHGTPSGIDNAVCTYGGVVKFKKNVTGSIIVPEARILLVNTRVNRQTKQLVEAVRLKRNSFPSIIDPILDSIDEISHYLASVIDKTPNENYSVIQELLSTNHWLLASLGVSHGSLNEIQRIAQLHGQAAKLTGAGGGGLAFVWLDPTCSDEQLRALEHDLSIRNFTYWPTRLGVKGVQIEKYQQT